VSAAVSDTHIPLRAAGRRHVGNAHVTAFKARCDDRLMNVAARPVDDRMDATLWNSDHAS